MYKLSLFVLAMFASAEVMAASADEIQVYDEDQQDGRTQR